MKLGLSLLGETEICLNGHLVGVLRAEKARALLFFIAVESDTSHRRDALAEMFWPEKPEGFGRNSLKQALATIRKALGDRNSKEPYLLANNQEVHFNAGSPYEVDVLEFENLTSIVALHSHQSAETCEPCAKLLETAVEIYQDDFLSGFCLPDCQAFDEWVIVKREKYKRMVADAIRCLISYHEGKEDIQKACELADRLVALEPWSESSQRILMRLLAASGKRSAALKQYHACVQILESELGVSPTPETISLFEQIKQWEFAEGPGKKPSNITEGEEASLNIVEPRSKPRRQPRRWVMGFALGSLIVLAGFIYVQWLKDNQGTFPTVFESTGNTNPEELTQNTTGSLTTAENDTSSGETNPRTISPAGMLPSEACLPGERLVYFEDFQDNKAQGWTEIEYRAQGWDIIPHPDSQGNMVAKFPCETDTQIQLSDYTFDNAVWRVHFMLNGKPTFIIFTWHLNANLGDWETYGVGILEEGIRVERSSEHFTGGVTLLDITQNIKKDVWHVLEISTYNGTLEVWLDGTSLLIYDDPQPLPEGKIGLELWASEFEGSMVYFDNLTVCELSGPFVSLVSLQDTTSPRETIQGEEATIQTNDQEKKGLEALIALYEVTGGANWNRNDGWLTDTSPCEWYGISCSENNLVELNLADNNLVGQIPIEIGYLSTLEVLDLRNNTLRGPIPPEIGNLNNLEYLDLAANESDGCLISGTLPVELGQLTNLITLQFDNCMIRGSIPPEIGNLGNLKILSLQGNQLSGPIPLEIFKLTQLESILLNGNQWLSGSLSPEIGQLNNLTGLSLGYNNFSGTLPEELGNLTRLRVLGLNENLFEGSLPLNLMNLNVSSFHFKETELCEPADPAFQDWLDSVYDLERMGKLCSEKNE